MIGLRRSRAGHDRRRIELRRVSKHYATAYGRKTILREVSLTIPFGVNFGIIGRSGAGKSTLMRLLAGVEAPTGGQIRRHGSVSWPLGRNFGLQPFLSGAENLRFVADLYGVPYGDLHDFVADFSELGAHLRSEVGLYSGGMRARLLHAVSIAVPFDFYLIDEAVRAGDRRFQDKLDQALAMRRRDATVVVISSSEAVLRQYCEKVAILADGGLQPHDDLEVALRRFRALQPEAAMADADAP